MSATVTTRTIHALPIMTPSIVSAARNLLARSDSMASCQISCQEDTCATKPPRNSYTLGCYSLPLEASVLRVDYKERHTNLKTYASDPHPVHCDTSSLTSIRRSLRCRTSAASGRRYSPHFRAWGPYFQRGGHLPRIIDCGKWRDQDHQVSTERPGATYRDRTERRFASGNCCS